MTEVLTTLALILAALLAIAGAVGTWAALRVGRNAQTLTNYRDAIQSWKERSETQEAENTSLSERIRKLEAENADLRGQLTVLRDAVSGRTGFDELSIMLSQQHQELLGRLDRLAGGR